MNRKNLIYAIAGGVLIAFSGLLFSNCQDDLQINNETSEIDLGTLEKETRTMRVAELAKAQAFYMKYQQPESKKTRAANGIKIPYVKDIYFPYIKDDPSWEFYAFKQNDTILTVNVDMTDRIAQDYVLKENWEEYKKEKQDRYLRSYTRYVYTRNLKTGEEDAFYMTIIPSLDYARNYTNRIRFNTYLNRDKYLSGYVLFHTLHGVFVNGWEYNNGKITGKVLPPELVANRENKKRLLLERIENSYSVALKLDVQSRAMARSESGDIDGGWMDEVVVTPDPKPDPDPEPIPWPDLWPDEPDPNPNPDPDPEPPIIDPDDGNSGGGGPIAPTKPTSSTLPAKLKGIYDLNRSTLTLPQTKVLAETITFFSRTSIGEFACNLFKEHPLAFIISSSIPSPAQFERNIGAIKFRECEVMANYKQTCEELVHAVQYYGFYGNEMTTKYANFDFEAKVLVDISVIEESIPTGLIGISFMENYPEYNNHCTEYANFIEGMAWDTIDKTTILEKYKNFANTWYEFQKDPSKGETPYGKMILDLDMIPKVLKEVIIDSN